MQMPKVRKAPYEIKVLGPGEYRICKQVLNETRFPAFVGRNMYHHISSRGGAFALFVDGNPVSVMLMNTKNNCSLVRATIRSEQKKGYSSVLFDYAKPTFERIILTESNYQFCAKRGFVPLGSPKQGYKHKVQIMARESVLKLAGRFTDLHERTSSDED